MGHSRIGLALAGGGPAGAVYEIGALRALDEALDGLDLNDCHVYVGVSAGSFLAACLANGMTPAQLVRAVGDTVPARHPFHSDVFFRPALGELLLRSWMTPKLLADALWDWARRPWDQSLLDALLRVSRALPVGLFDNEPLRAFLAHSFTGFPGRTDDFRELGRHLVVVAADLDSGTAVRFGEPGFDHVPISRAVQASTALPGIYPPVLIDGRYYLDGVLLKTLHGSVALEAGAELLLCINPIVPVDTEDAVEAGVMRRGKLVDRGLPTVLSQTFRTLVHSRLTVGLASYAPRWPDRDVLLFEPPRDDYRMFFTNVFSLTTRRSVLEHAYRATRRSLRDRAGELGPVFERHGLRFRPDAFDDLDRDPWSGVGLGPTVAGDSVTDRLTSALDRLDAVLERTRAG